MTYSTLIFLSRKQGTTPSEFRSYYNDKHMPFFRSLLVGHTDEPKRHTQWYIERTTTTTTSSSTTNPTERNPNTPATVYVGTQADFDYDVMVVIEYKDFDAFKHHVEFLQQPEIAAKIAADEENFLDRSQTRAVALGESIVTGTDV